jgi:uncharacterized protein YjbI with pentapeptide repeats
MVDTSPDRLRADCSRCAALCCVALSLRRSADFAIDKLPDVPCPNLAHDFGCRIHDRLRPAGFAGCVSYDCYGAGQRLVQVTFGGRDWRDLDDPSTMFALLPRMRHLHELLWYLADGLSRELPPGLTDELSDTFAEVDAFAAHPPDELLALDGSALWRRCDTLLDRVSQFVREPAPESVARQHADLAGARLTDRDLRRADLRSALLIGADLRRTDLRRADLRGADLRAAELAGADLRDALYLTQSQVSSAHGDASTRIPSRLGRPLHWTAATSVDEKSTSHPRRGAHG